MGGAKRVTRRIFVDRFKQGGALDNYYKRGNVGFEVEEETPSKQRSVKERDDAMTAKKIQDQYDEDYAKNRRSSWRLSRSLENLNHPSHSQTRNERSFESIH